MNPLTNMKNVTKLSERELQNNSKSSWHDQYRDSAWIFIGGLPYDLTEGDIICIFSQYGEVVNINLIRDKDSGKSKGFCFLCYEDQRSTDLTVDNLNGIKVLNRILRVDHVSEYKIPKEGKQTGDETKKLYNEGCAPKAVVPVAKNPLVENPQYRRETLADQIQAEIKLPARLPIRTEVKREIDLDLEGPVKVKTEKVKTKKKKSRRYSESDDEDSTDSENQKKEKRKRDFDKYSEKESHRRKHDARSADGRSRDRSKSDERKKRPRELSTERSERRRSRSQSLNRNRKNRSRSRSLEKQPKSNRSKDYDKKRSEEKYRYSDRNKQEKFRRK